MLVSSETTAPTTSIRYPTFTMNVGVFYGGESKRVRVT